MKVFTSVLISHLQIIKKKQYLEVFGRSVINCCETRVLCVDIGLTRCDRKPRYLFISKKEEMTDDCA
jgi:hypothetical protein